MSRQLTMQLIEAARYLHSHDNDPLEVPCATNKEDSMQVASDRLGLCVMATITSGFTDQELDIALSRKDAIAVACALLVHAGGLPE